MGGDAMSPYAIAAIILLLGFAGFLAATEKHAN